MKRRTALRSLLAVPSVAMLPPVAPAQEVKGTSAESPKALMTDAEAASDPVVRTFNEGQFSALRKLGEIVMPASAAAPGASEARAAEFLDFLIGVSPPARVALYKAGLDRLNAEAQQRYQKSFGEITVEQSAPILAPLLAPWSHRGPSDSFARFLLAAKGDLLTATANSREYIAAVSQRRRGAGGMGQYWYSVE